MSIITTTVIAAALVAAAGSAHADTRADPACSTLTVTIAHRADIPAGLSVRALQEGRNYPDHCR